MVLFYFAQSLSEESSIYRSGMAAKLVDAPLTVTDDAGDWILQGESGASFVLSHENAHTALLGDDEREVRLFISSTFVDMEAERDLLIRQVFPSLSAFCAERGVRLVPFDLRWGITEAQSRQGSTIEVTRCVVGQLATKVLLTYCLSCFCALRWAKKICLREVDRSRPYFLALLGSRYGWAQPVNEEAPRDALLDATMERAARAHPWLARYTDRSITELEVRHAVLNVVAPDAEMAEQRSIDASDRPDAFGSSEGVASRALFFLRDDDPSIAGTHTLFL